MKVWRVEMRGVEESEEFEDADVRLGGQQSGIPRARCTGVEEGRRGRVKGRGNTFDINAEAVKRCICRKNKWMWLIPPLGNSIPCAEDSCPIAEVHMEVGSKADRAATTSSLRGAIAGRRWLRNQVDQGSKEGACSCEDLRSEAKLTEEGTKFLFGGRALVQKFVRELKELCGASGSAGKSAVEGVEFDS